MAVMPKQKSSSLHSPKNKIAFSYGRDAEAQNNFSSVIYATLLLWP